MLRTYTIEECGEYGVIYCLTSPKGKCYIGQSWLNMNTRWRFYKNCKCNKQTKLYRALKKYGPENFKYEIIDFCENQIEMDNKEIWYINICDTINNGYNCKEGGHHGRHTEEVKLKMSKDRVGHIVTQETCDKISEAKKAKNIIGDKCHMFGKNRSIEIREKISKGNSGENNHMFGKTLSDEILKKIKETRENNYEYFYEIVSPTNITYTTKNLNEFCKINNLCFSVMSKVSLGKRNHYKKWKVRRIYIK